MCIRDSLSGAAIAIQSGIGGINMGEWAKVLYGLVLSLALGFATGWAVCKLVTLVCRGMDRRKTGPFFRIAQIFGAAAMSFMHGAQAVSYTHLEGYKRQV